MIKPFVEPKSNEWYRTIRMMNEDKADAWAEENQERYDKYHTCQYCDYCHKGHCVNLYSSFMGQDVEAEDDCTEWEWGDDDE